MHLSRLLRASNQMAQCLLFVLSIFTVSSLHSSTVPPDLFLGPEIYYAKRTKEGGVEQKGVQYGIRAGYERVGRYKFYYALDGLYSWGLLEGKKKERHIKSQFTNANIETRFGYTFEMKNWPQFSFTPFIGAGYMWEINRFVHPSPITAHFENKYSYIPFGFLSSISYIDNWSIGFNFKCRYIWQGKQKVSHDPEYGQMWQCYQEFFQYRYECPIATSFCFYNLFFYAKCIPFYEYRHYGSRANFPFDFIDTQYRFYGATLELLYPF